MQPKSPDEPAVKLNFNGVLVGRHDSRANVFEVGVLPSPEHTFSITIKEVGPISTTTSTINFNEIGMADKTWIFEVEDRPSDAYISPLMPIGNRMILPTSGSTEGENFNWVLDFENPHEFCGHPIVDGKLAMQRGLLKPIILVKQGRFHTESLSDLAPSERKLGHGPFQPFGYTSQTVSADIDAAVDEEIVLKVQRTEAEIFRRKLRRDHRFEITIDNIPDSHHDQNSATPPPVIPNQPSHLQLFYLLFHTAYNERYDLRLPSPNEQKSMTMHGADIPAGAPSPYKCGLIYLSGRTTPLE